MTATELTVFDAPLLQQALTSRDVGDDVVRRVREAVEAEPVDLTTARGRKAVASLAYKVAQTKTAIDRAAKALTADYRAKTDAVNEERSRMVGELQAIQDAARKPLDDWEAAEEKRVEMIRTRLSHIDPGAVDAFSPIAEIKAAIERVVAIDLETGWDEFAAEAASAHAACLASYQSALTAAEKAEADRIEMERLRAIAEQAERDRKEREEADRIAAESKARQEREAREAKERAEREAYEAEQRKAREKAEAEARAKREAESKERHARELLEAQKRAAEQERRRIAAKAESKERAEVKRKADAAHRAKVLAEIAADLDGLTPMQAAEKIAAGFVRNVRAMF